MNSFWRGFEQGRFFRIAFMVILRSLAVLTALAGVVYWIGIWFSVARHATVGLVVGWFVAELFYAIALVVVVWLLWQRGGKILRLSGETFPNFDLMAVIVRLIGEISSVLLSMGGIAGMILIWAAGQQIAEPLRLFIRLSGRYALYRPPDRFLVGLGYGVYGIVQAILVLLLTYFLAEAILLFKGILMNTQVIRQRVEEPRESGAENPPEAGEEAPSVEV